MKQPYYQLLGNIFRVSQCALFCSALHKPFEEHAVPLRCKRLINMEQFPKDVNNLEYRAMKRIRRAVTVPVPNRFDGDEKYHIVGSILFIKEIKGWFLQQYLCTDSTVILSASLQNETSRDPLS